MTLVEDIEIPIFAPPWNKSIESLANLHDFSVEKSITQIIEQHYQEIRRIKQNKRNVIAYTDASKPKNSNKVGISVIFTLGINQISMKSMQNISVDDGEMQAIAEAINICRSRNSQNKEIWIFTDSQWAIQRLKAKSSNNSALCGEIQKDLIFLKNRGCKTYISWIPGHRGILGNEKADDLAKYASKPNLELDQRTTYASGSIKFAKQQIRKEMHEDWQKIWNKSTKKGQHYRKFVTPMIGIKSLSRLKDIDRLSTSTYMQLRMGHGYFKEYLYRMKKNDTNRCYGNCRAIQTPEHLLLHCKHYRKEQEKLKEKAQLKGINDIKILFNTKIGIAALLGFLKKTRLATRTWILGNIEEEI